MHCLNPVPPNVTTTQEPYHERNATITVQFTIQGAFPPVELENIQWSFQNAILNTSCPECNPRYNFSDDLLSLTIFNLQVSDNGSFTLRASNPAGVHQAEHNVTVYGKNSILPMWIACA